MTIVHVSAYFAPAWGFGGPPRSLLALCQAQQRAGLDVEMFTTTANPDGGLRPAPEGTLMDGVPVRYFPQSAPRALLWSRAMAAPLAAALERADIAHLHGLFNGSIWLAGWLARSRVRYVVSPRGMLLPAALRHHGWRKRAAWRLFDRALVHGAACWHATSGVEADELRRRDPRIPVIEVPNPVDLVDATPVEVAAAREWASLPAQDPFILFLGRVHPIKRLDLLARAFTSVAKELPRARLVIAGPDEGGHRSAVEPLFAPAASRVHWVGPVEGAVKRGLLVGASALVQCSDSESFGLSIAEALASGTPVVVTRTCPWPAIATEGCGFWVEQSPDAVAQALVMLVHHGPAARTMAERGREYVRRELTLDAVGRRWAAIYGGLA
ncbi:MAG: glycosyltransferase [Acidobacteriota bacterium]